MTTADSNLARTGGIRIPSPLTCPTESFQNKGFKEKPRLFPWLQYLTPEPVLSTVELKSDSPGIEKVDGRPGFT
jgi:hypothetical protein